MSRFEILCVTLNQNGFDKIGEMRIDSDVVFANQADSFGYAEYRFNGHIAKMITTQTRGVGINRNTAMSYADSEICLLADDDMKYVDGYEKTIVDEFDAHPKADIIFFNIGTSTPQFGRIPTQIKKFRRFHFWNRNPFGAPRIAIRLRSIQRTGIQFSTLFGGGALYLFGEDSIWIKQMMRSGMKIYLSPKTIGDVSYGNSTWFTKNIEEVCYSRGAGLAASNRRLAVPLSLLYSLREKRKGASFKNAFKWHMNGIRSLKNPKSYEEYLASNRL